MPGLVPHVTCGPSVDTSTSTSRSNVASASVGRPRHRSSARSQSAPFGAPGRPSRYANVVSSGAIIPARAPASIDMLQTVRRPSIDSASITGPAYSITCPAPPPTPSLPIAASTMSFAVTPRASRPWKLIRIVRGLRCVSVCVARTCSTSDVPIPNASAPNAPCVEVCESPQTIVMPGWERPSSGPITCTIPSLPLPVAKSGTPNSSQFRASAASCCSESGSIGVSSPVATL